MSAHATLAAPQELEPLAPLAWMAAADMAEEAGNDTRAERCRDIARMLAPHVRGGSPIPLSEEGKAFLRRVLGRGWNACFKVVAFSGLAPLFGPERFSVRMDGLPGTEHAIRTYAGRADVEPGFCGTCFCGETWTTVVYMHPEDIGRFCA